MLKKANKYLSYWSICLMLASHVATSVQISAQEVLEKSTSNEQVMESSGRTDKEQLDNKEASPSSSDLKESDILIISETRDSDEETIDLQEELEDDTEDINESTSSDRENLATEMYRIGGYSHVETEPGSVVVTTPNDATIETLVNYLTNYYRSSDINSLTINGMVDTGTNSSAAVDRGWGLSNYTNLSYLEMTDLEIVGEAALMDIPNLKTIYIPKVKSIEALAFWRNRSLLVLDAPVVEEIGINAFYDVPNLEVLLTPNWANINVDAGFALGELGPSNSLREISTANFGSSFTAATFPNVEKQTINKDPNATTDRPQRGDNYIIFENVNELTISKFPVFSRNGINGDYSNVKSISSNTIVGVDLAGFTSLEKIDFDEQLTTIFANSFSGTKIETLRLSSLVFNLNPDVFVGADHLKEVYLPNVATSFLPNTMYLPGNLEIIGTTSARLAGFQNIANDNPSVLFAATESNELLPLEDQQITIGESGLLKTDVSTFILNEDLSQTSFELTQNWFFEDELVGESDIFEISKMSSSNVGTYFYSVNLTPTGNATYLGSRESRRAQVDIGDEINFLSDFSVLSIVGDSQELEIPFTSNVTNMHSTIQISVPESIKVDDQNIEIYLDTSSSLPLGAVVSKENQVITISNFPLLVGFDYHISIPIMPIAISDEMDEIEVEFKGKYDPLKTSGKVVIASGEFMVSIPDRIDFEEVSLDVFSAHSTIEKANQLDIDITSFTALEESWEIMVRAAPFMNGDNQEIDEEIMRLVYKENERVIDLSEDLLLSSGSFTGELDYDFQTNTWKNNSHVLSQLEDEGFLVFIGNNYYELEGQQLYTTELNFTIQYSP